MREIKFSFMWQHQETGRWMDKRYALEQIIAGDPYDDFSDQPFLKRYHHVATREYTGLKDKNGADYFIGDVGRFDNGDRFVLRMEDWLEVYADWIGDAACEDQVRDLYRISSAENIGNIYENHELLEEK
jgi:hypothetical protein